MNSTLRKLFTDESGVTWLEVAGIVLIVLVVLALLGGSVHV
jgi:Flp pilus assembly pilin Flp